MIEVPSSIALCKAATKLQYPVHFFPLYSIAKRFSEGLSDQKEKFNKSIVKMNSTVDSSLAVGCSSCVAHVLVEYSFCCIRLHMVCAAALVPRESIATSIALL